MTKYSLCIFTAAVLLGGATSEFLCLIHQLLAVTPDHFFSNPRVSCQDVETKFARVRKELKRCTRYEIDISLLESLHNDFCNLNSDYRQKFNRQERCITGNIPNVRSCLDRMSGAPNLSPYSDLGKAMSEVCTSLSLDISECLNEKAGQPCGSEGLEVYGRITKASEPFFKGICLDAASTALGGTETRDEIYKAKEVVTEAEDGIVEAAVAEGVGAVVNCEQHAGAAANSVFLWCMLLGLLFTVKW